MRRTASEVLSDLEIRVARLETQSEGKEINTLRYVMEKIEERYRITFTQMPSYNGRFILPSTKVFMPDHEDVKHSVRKNLKITIESINGISWSLNWN